MMKQAEERNRGTKEDMNKPSDASTISVNRHEKMGAFKSMSLWQLTATEVYGEKKKKFPSLYPVRIVYLPKKKKDNHLFFMGE